MKKEKEKVKEKELMLAEHVPATTGMAADKSISEDDGAVLVNVVDDTTITDAARRETVIAKLKIVMSRLEAAQKDTSASARVDEQALNQEFSQLLAELPEYGRNPLAPCGAAAPNTCPALARGSTTTSRPAPRTSGRSKR